MHISAFAHTFRSTAAAMLVAIALAGCSVDKQQAPGLTGPSEYGLSVTLAASPDILPRDGQSVSVINVTVRDAQSKPVSGQRVALSASTGSLSAGEVVTASNGVATFLYTAPSMNAGSSVATIGATPIGTNFDNAVTRTVSVALAGPGLPIASFTVSPAAVKRYEVATLDASATTVAGVPCGSACTYTWTVGSDSFTGQSALYRFLNEGTFVVTLTVTGPGGTTASSSHNVAVAAATVPTAQFTASPTNPRPADTVFFNGSASTAAGGASIVEYSWDFGDGHTAVTTTPTTSNVFAVARIYVVRLTVKDSNGVTGTVTTNLTVSVPTS
jgi:PKD repeat protein